MENNVEVKSGRKLSEPIRQYQDPVEVESGIKKKGVLTECLRGFRLKTVDGPLIDVLPGQKVELFDRRLIEDLFFCDRIRPISPTIPAQAEYVVYKKFTTVVDGLFKQLYLGDVLELNYDEAIPLLKRRCVKPVNDSNFFI